METEADPHGLVEQPDRWSLNVGAGVVTQLQIDFAFGFTLEQRLYFRVETPFAFGAEGDATEYEPEDSATLCPLLDLHQARVVAGDVFKDGRLVVRFAGGKTLFVPPHDQYEAFQVTGSRMENTKFHLIALPGGGLAEWT
ncbi:MAG: DUF6188 family protein [Actinomycetota bacterium]|nr:DUF6188 family protein [Actinomycetota bacterium]